MVTFSSAGSHFWTGGHIVSNMLYKDKKALAYASAFFNEAHLTVHEKWSRASPHEARLRRTERSERFASCERSECFTETDRFPLHVCRRQTLHCWTLQLDTAVVREIAAVKSGFYFTFCGAENFTTTERLFHILHMQNISLFFELWAASAVLFVY